MSQTQTFVFLLNGKNLKVERGSLVRQLRVLLFVEVLGVNRM